MCLSLYEYSHFSVCNGKLFKDPKLTVEQILAVLQLYFVKTNPYEQVHQEEQLSDNRLSFETITGFADGIMLMFELYR